MITLGNKDFVVWDISTDSTLLGVTDTWMNSHFARSGLTYKYKIFDFFFSSFLPFIVLKTSVSFSQFQRKNRFEKRATLTWDICKKYFSTAHQTKSPAKNCFSLICQPRVGCFSNWFLCWNRDIETLVLSTIKDTNGAEKMLRILSMNLKYCLKNPKLRKN